MNRTMKEEVEKTLRVLIGLPLRDSGRSADLQWFDFGSNLTTVSTRNGETKTVGEYVIDTECAWHIAGPNGIIVGSRDRLYPAGEDPYKDLLEFDWDKTGANRCDEKIKKLFEERKNKPLFVQSLEANNWGGVKINLSENYTFEIFPDDSLGGEYWRFYEPSKSSRHFVVTGQGIEGRSKAENPDQIDKSKE